MSISIRRNEIKRDHFLIISTLEKQLSTSYTEEIFIRFSLLFSSFLLVYFPDHFSSSINKNHILSSFEILNSFLINYRLKMKAFSLKN